MEKTQSHYRELRKKLGLPASIALTWARERQVLEQKISKLGIEWRAQNGLETARWFQKGFDIVAVIETDQNGWWTFGESDYGRFSNQWQPGAICHNEGIDEFGWFIPADPGQGRQCYRKAVRYGWDWWYVVLTAKAFRHGVLLAEESICGLEYDLDTSSSERELMFSRIALELADQAIAEACAKLKELCADQSCTA